ncbi:right-handed parallel beta-helix repeat-containing protein [Nonomuraea sp. B5E05]|uniref:right-handed parallel beta-helix repeat-containing protein n=1 Tax=Nonomuraea sp. B5E05 TaxID=3153569 RepID=UPI00326022E7
MRFTSKVCTVVALAGAALGPVATPAVAAPVTCSAAALKRAIERVNTVGGTLDLQAGCVYRLAQADNGANGLPVIRADVTVNGNGATIERAAYASAFRIFQVKRGGKLTLNRVTLRNGRVDGANGGAVLVDPGGALTLQDSVITGSSAAKGGAVYTQGSISVRNSQIVGNTATEVGNSIGTGSSAAVIVSNSTVADQEGPSVNLGNTVEMGDLFDGDGFL